MKHLQLFESFNEIESLNDKSRELASSIGLALNFDYSVFSHFEIIDRGNEFGIKAIPLIKSQYYTGDIVKILPSKKEAYAWISSIIENHDFQKYIALRKHIEELKNKKVRKEELSVTKMRNQCKRDVMSMVATSTDYTSFLNDFLLESVIKTPVYHGTPHKFTDFKLGKYQNTERVDGTYQFYFTSNKGEAREYGNNIVECYINTKNPSYADGNNGISYHLMYMDEAEANGNDCVIIDMSWSKWYLLSEDHIHNVMTEALYNSYKKKSSK